MCSSSGAATEADDRCCVLKVDRPEAPGAAQPPGSFPFLFFFFEAGGRVLELNTKALDVWTAETLLAVLVWDARSKSYERKATWPNESRRRGQMTNESQGSLEQVSSCKRFAAVLTS